MRSISLLVGVALVACASNPVEEASSGSSSGGTSTSTSTTTTSATTTMDASTTTDGSTGPVDSSGPAESSGPADSSTTGDPNACDFATTVADSIADAKDPVDCGQLTLDDPLTSWSEARECARSAQLSQVPFFLMWQWDDAGVLRDRAYATVGFSMPLLYLEDDAAMDTTSITSVTCSGTGNPGNCEVAIGELCLECLDPTIEVELCD